MMARGSLNREILRLAIPSIFANITVPLVGMADIAVTGHLDAIAGGWGAAVLVGGIAIGSMLFDFLYWNFSFLRSGTGGLTAQAYGRGDRGQCAAIFLRALSLSLLIGLALLALQWIFVQAAFCVVDCSEEVRLFAEKYFYIRIWAAPATLSLFAFKGWFIGMQDTVSPMLTDLIVNLLNIFASIVLTFGIGPFRGIGYNGVALGTVLAQWTGFLFASCIVLLRYHAVFAGTRISGAFADRHSLRLYFSTSSDLMIRSLSMLGVYIGFTIISAHYGDLLLSVGAILMKLLMIFSYFTDGFAYAGEALTGRFIGEAKPARVRETVRKTFAWSMSIALLFIGIYYLAGELLLRVMTSDESVIAAALPFLPWLLVMPLLGCPAFTWDGIFIGATRTRALRDNTLWSAIGFFACWLIGVSLLHPQGEAAIHLLLAAYFVHLSIRTIYLSIDYRRHPMA